MEKTKEVLNPENVNKQVDKTVDAVKRSKIASKIPLEIQHIVLKDFLRFAIFVKFCFLIPVHFIVLVISESSDSWLSKILGKSEYLFGTITLWADMITVLLVYFLSASGLFYVPVVTAFIKNCLIFAMTFPKMLGSNFSILHMISYAIMIIELVGIDGLVLYYCILYFDSEVNNKEKKGDNKGEEAV